MRVNFTPAARADLRSIRDWIAQDSPSNAERVIARIVQTALMFGSFPMLGRPGRIEGTREFAVTGLPYLIVYKLENEAEVDILTIFHTRRQMPD